MDIEETYERFLQKLKEAFPGKKIDGPLELRFTKEYQEERINVRFRVSEPGPPKHHIVFMPTDEFLEIEEVSYNLTCQRAFEAAKELLSRSTEEDFLGNLTLTTTGSQFMEPSKKMDT